MITASEAQEKAYNYFKKTLKEDPPKYVTFSDVYMLALLYMMEDLIQVISSRELRLDSSIH